MPEHKKSEYDLRHIEEKKMGCTLMEWTTVGLGTWMMEKNPKTSIAALRAGLDHGANHIDTAEMYGDGQVEEIVGHAIEGRRNNMFLVSKVLPHNATFQGTREACHRSLKRLKTDYLDLYVLHWREKETSLSETFRAFEALKQEGKIRYWGVSNFDVPDMEEAVRLVGEGKIVCNQVLYHLKERAVEEKLLPWCESHNVALVGYSPLGQGHLPPHDVLEKIAKTHNATSAQIALAFLTRQKSVFVIPKSSDIGRTKQNVESMAISLSESEIHALNEAFPMRPRQTLPMI